MGRVSGKVALVTGAARGQGRAHATTLAREGAQIVAIDICDQIPSVAIPMSTPEDLERTAALVEQQDQRCLAIEADTRDSARMRDVIDRTISEFGRIDIVAANHGIAHLTGWEDVTDAEWRDSLDTNVVGVWNSVRPAIPHMIEQGGGSIIMTASIAGFRAFHQMPVYTAAKHAVVGLMRSLSADLGRHWIRVNVIAPGMTDTPMNDNDVVWGVFSGGKPGATADDARFTCDNMNLLPVPWAPPEALANGLLFLASDESKHVTGMVLPVDSGMGNQPPGIPIGATERLAELESAE